MTRFVWNKIKWHSYLCDQISKGRWFCKLEIVSCYKAKRKSEINTVRSLWKLSLWINRTWSAHWVENASVRPLLVAINWFCRRRGSGSTIKGTPANRKRSFELKGSSLNQKSEKKRVVTSERVSFKPSYRLNKRTRIKNYQKLI